MRKPEDDKELKKELQVTLTKLGILPDRQGRITINTTPDRSISTIEVAVLYR